MKITGVVYICECGNKFVIDKKNFNFKIYTAERDFQENETYFQMTGKCPKCKKEIYSSIGA